MCCVLAGSPDGERETEGAASSCVAGDHPCAAGWWERADRLLKPSLASGPQSRDTILSHMAAVRSPRGCVPHSSSSNVTTRISFLAGASPHLPWFCALARFPGGWEKASVSHPGGTKNLGCFLLTQARPTKVSQRKWRRAAEGGQQPYRDGEADALLRERAGLTGGFPSHFFPHQIKRVTAAEHSPLASEASWRGRHTADFLVLSLPV